MNKGLNTAPAPKSEPSSNACVLYIVLSSIVSFFVADFIATSELTNKQTPELFFMVFFVILGLGASILSYRLKQPIYKSALPLIVFVGFSAVAYFYTLGLAFAIFMVIGLANFLVKKSPK